MSAWTCRSIDGKADSEEKHEPASDIDIVVVDSLKALDPKRPIREADIRRGDTTAMSVFVPSTEVTEEASVL